MKTSANSSSSPDNIPSNLVFPAMIFYLSTDALVVIFCPTALALANNPSSSSHLEDHP